MIERWLDVGSAALYIVTALAILLAGPRRPLNRALALWLALVGMVFATASIDEFTADPWLTINADVYNLVAWIVGYPAWLLFVGLAVASPLARPLRHWLVQGVLFAWMVVGAVLPLVMLWPDGSDVSTQVFYRLSFPILSVVIFSYSLIASVDALRRAPRGSQARAQARAYLTTFGLLEGTVIFIVGSRLTPDVSLLRALDTVYFFLPMQITFVFLLARAMLKYQLFDFELKLKWTLNRGTIAAVFVAAFFAVSEIVSGLLSEQIGLVTGVLATALLVFAMSPLQRFAERVSDAAMPRVKDSEEYRTVRKREVYRAAVESAMQDGQVTAKERDVLATLADELGLTVKDATEIERQAARTLSRAATAPPGAT